MTRSMSRRNTALFGGVVLLTVGLVFGERAAGASSAPAVVPHPPPISRASRRRANRRQCSPAAASGESKPSSSTSRASTSATSGYAGGTVEHPEYEQVSSGTTGHAESVKVVFDPTQVTYAQLLQVFFSVAHDPTELNRQGPDVGTQYRSIVFYSTPEQKATVDAYIAQLTKAKTFSRPIVTQVVPFKKFWPAEAYHQNYAELHPTSRTSRSTIYRRSITSRSSSRSCGATSSHRTSK